MFFLFSVNETCDKKAKRSALQMFSAGLQAPYRDFGVQGYQNCRGYV